MGEVALNEFDNEIINGRFIEFVEASKKIQVPEVAEHAGIVASAFKAQREFLAYASVYVKPDDMSFQKLLEKTANAIADVQKYRESRRSSKFFNHLSAISESIPALAWVTISPTPAPHIKEMNDAGQFYTNRVLKEFKDKPGHAEWVKTWIGVLTTLQTFVKKHHTTGLVWGKKAGGGPVGGPPGAPPPPPPPSFDLDMGNGNEPDTGRAALFAELNKGEDITKGLKKITVNKGEKKSGVVSSTTNNTSHGKGISKGPPKFALEGKKWVIENQVGVKNLSIGDDVGQMNHVIYLYGCTGSTLNVTATKVNSIVVDSCSKTAVVFNSVVSSIEFVNCRDCQMQVMGTVPTITIDKTDGLQTYLSEPSLGVEIVSAKSSALNVLVPAKDFKTSGDFVELAIPEQFKTVISTSSSTSGKHNQRSAYTLVTSPTELVGV